MTKASWVKMVFYVFALMMCVGVFLNFGLGWALMAAGFIGAVSALTLHDVDEKKAVQK